MITLTKNTLSEWAADAGSFEYEFMRHSLECRRAIGIDLQFSRTEIAKAHSEWVETCALWKATYFEQDVECLSYTKQLAILLHCLSKRQFITEMHQYDQSGHRSEYKYVGDAQAIEDERQDFAGAPDIVCAMDFCLSALNFYEENRLDRDEPFTFRLTASLRDDMIHMLGSHPHDAMSVYLLIESLYSRH